ncbi:MAG: phenylalanine--tRNA ligase subunit beta, partial [Firmicutes bacterium]|nr:phenylalanine--tRNA ligase subunit beta [Bacillota bacterium]
MLVPIEWLKDYTNVNVDIDEFCDRMIMSGSNLETATHMCEDIKGVVVGKIMEKKAHPDSDHLSICMTDVGADRLLQIVCGAPNVREGICVPVAL